MHRLLPVLKRAFAALGVAPERDASQVATNPLALEGAPDGVIDGTERRRQRPTNAVQQKEQDSGKKKAHTDKNLVLLNAHTTKVIYLGPTVAGKIHDKKAADANATLGKDTGLQGYEPAGVLTQQPKKSPEAKSEAWRTSSSITSSLAHVWSSKTCLPGSNGVGLSKRSYASPPWVSLILSWRLRVDCTISG